jgi:hypothetical protein
MTLDTYALLRNNSQVWHWHIHLKYLVYLVPEVLILCDVFLVFQMTNPKITELDDGKNYRKTLYLMVKTMVSCRFSLKPIHWYLEHIGIPMKIYQYLFISLFIGKSSHVLRWSTENVVKTVRIRSAPGRLPVAFLHGHLHQGYSCLKDGGKPVDLGKLCI